MRNKKAIAPPRTARGCNLAFFAFFVILKQISGPRARAGPSDNDNLYAFRDSVHARRETKFADKIKIFGPSDSGSLYAWGF